MTKAKKAGDFDRTDSSLVGSQASAMCHPQSAIPKKGATPMTREKTLGLFVLALAVLVPTGWCLGQNRPPGTPTPTRGAEARRAVDQLGADLREAQGLLPGVTDKRTRERLELL